MSRLSSPSSPLPWLRLYTEFASDPKVQLLSEAMQRRFVMLLCLAGSRVTPTKSDDAIGYALRLNAEHVAETKRVLQSAGLIDVRWFPKAWHRRQRPSDHDAAERQRRSRQRRGVISADVTDLSRDSHTLDKNREEQSREDQSREEQTVPSEPVCLEPPTDASRGPAVIHELSLINGKRPPPQFVELRVAYPSRAGSQRWPEALRACRARVREGTNWREIIDGAHRYAAYCAATDKVRTQFVMQASTFCGPEKHFLEPWTPPPSKAERRRDANVAAAQRWLSEQENCESAAS